MENLSQKHGLVSRTYYKRSLIMASTFSSKSKFFMTISIPSQDETLTNRPVSTSDRCLIELENQVQCLMEAHLAPIQPNQVNKVTTSCEICSGPHDTQYCMEYPQQAFVEYASSRTDEAGGPNRNANGIKWLDVKEPLDLVDTSKELVYESLIKEMPKCSLNYDFMIKMGDPRNLKIPCMIGHKFTTNAYINVDLPMNIMSLAYYNSIRMNGYEYMGRNFIGLGRDMHVFIGNMSYVIDFTILESIENNINPSLSNVVFGRPFVKIACLAINRKYGLMTLTDGIKGITFKTSYKDPKRSELSSEGHDLLSSRVILSEDDYDRGCRKPSDLEDGFYRDTIKLGPEYATGMDDEGEVTKFLIKNEEEFFKVPGDGVGINPTASRLQQCRKAHLLEDKQIPSVWIFDEVFSTWMAFGGNTRDLGSFREEKTRLRTYTKSMKRSRRNIRDVIRQRLQKLRRNGALGGVGDEEVVVGEGVVVTSSSLEMLTNSCLGGIMVSLIFLEGLEEEALVEWFEEDEDGKKNGKEGLFNLKA
ncbi:hypothetical protein Tco_1518087 [Tanacetum coccineum]